MNPVVREYLLKKRQPSKLTEEDAPEPEGMAPDELATPSFDSAPPMVSAPDAPAEPADYDAIADLKAAQGEAKRENATNRFLEGAQTVNDAFTHSGVDQFAPSNAVQDAKDRGQTVREYVLQKYRDRLGSAQQMNAHAALNNSLRQRQTPQAKPVDPLDEEAKRAKIEKDRALAERAKRAPVVKPPKVKGPKGAKDLTPSALSELATFDVAAQELDNLGKSFDALGMDGAGGKWAGRATDALGMQGTDAAKYQADAKRAMQAVGTILEGGKLAAGDEVKYREMLPKAGDSREVAQRKIAGLKAFLADLKKKKIEAYNAGGYNAPALDHSDGNAASGRVMVTNGSETLEIDADDLADAEADGYRRAE